MEQQIADILLLTIEQVISCKNSMEYRKKYSETADEIIKRQIDLEEGWDVVEEKAVARVLETLEFNRDPAYALLAARTANQAKRHKNREQSKVIDTSGGSKPSNVITLNLNRTYILNAQNTPTGATIDVSPKTAPEARRISDLPTPKAVSELLAPVTQGNVTNTKHIYSELEEAFHAAGVFKDND